MQPNIEKFDEIAALIFEKAYAAFPVEIMLNFYELAGQEAPAHRADLSGDVKFAAETATWLLRSGYLISSRGAPTRGEYSMPATLSAKTLEALKGLPSSLSKDKTLGQSLLEASGEANKEARKTIVGEIIRFGIKATLGG